MDDFAFTPPPPPQPQASPTAPPAPPARKNRHRLPALAAGAAVAGLAVGAAALAGAATQPSGAPTQETAPPNQPAPPNPPGPPDHPGPRGPKGPRVGVGPGIHGEFVVPAPNGGFETLASQRGTVSDVSATSIKLKSEDGFERTYVVDENTVVNAGRDGIADVKNGDTVQLVAVVTGSTAKAVEVRDMTTLEQHRGTWVPKPRRGGPAGSPGSTTTTTG